MIELWPVATAALGAALLFFANRRQRGRRRAWIAWQQARFGLRLETPDEKPVVLGDSPAGDEKTIVSREAVLENGGSRRVIVRAGTKLRVIQLEGVTRDGSGAVQIPKDVHVWVLDAEGTTETDSAGKRTLRLGSGEYEITTGAPPMAPDLRVLAPWLRWPHVFFALSGLALLLPADARIGGSLAAQAPAWWRLFKLWADAKHAPRPGPDARASLDEDPAFETKWLQFKGPLWLQRLFSPDDWILPEKSGAPGALVYDLGDPHAIDGIDRRDDAVAGAAFVLGDAMHLLTDARVEVGIPAVVGRSRVIRTHMTTRWDVVASSVAEEGGRRLVVFGDALPDLARDGFAIRMRASEGAGTEEASLHGPFPDLAERLVTWMAESGWARCAGPRAGLALPASGIVDLYLRVHDVVALAAMRGRSNSFLPPAEAPWYAKAIDLAGELVTAAPELAQSRLLWAVTAIYAEEAGKLDAERKDRVLGMVRAASGEDVVALLAPAIFARLGSADEARAGIAKMREDARGPYRDVRTPLGAWLTRVEESLG
jgi:hypothetical protein